MIRHEPLVEECVGTRVPVQYYKYIQEMAFKYDTSPRVVSTILMCAGIRSVNLSELDGLINAYHWYQENKYTPEMLNKNQRKLLKEVHDSFDVDNRIKQGMESMNVQNKFKWTGDIQCLMDNINQADMVFAFDVEYQGKKQGKNPELNQKADLYVYGKKVPVGATLVQDERSHWSIKK